MRASEFLSETFNQPHKTKTELKPGVSEAAGAVTFAGQDPNKFQSPKGGKPVWVIQTEQGSRYLITSDGMVLRDKSVHANTGGEDAGLQAWSDHIEFYDKSKPLIFGAMQPFAFPDAVSYLLTKGRIALSQGQNGERIAIILDNDKWRPATIADAMPKAAQANPEWAKIVIKADAGTWGLEPKLGWQPLDYNQRGDGTLNRVHNGSNVTHGAKVQQSVAEQQRIWEGVDDESKDKVTNAVVDFYQHVGKIHSDPIDDYVGTAKEMLGHVKDTELKSKLLNIFRQAKENPYIQGGVVTTVGALLAGGVLSSAQKMGLNPAQTNLMLQAILNTVIPTVVSRINGKSWADTAKYTLASAGIGTGIAGMMEE
jgi:hypothetical protein